MKRIILALTASALLSVFADDVLVRRTPLRNAPAAFARGRGTVAFLGGSITEMNGYRPRMAADLAKRFPKTAFTFTAAGIGSTCSDTGAFRFREDVLEKGIPDLLFVEFAVNDDQDGHFTRAHAIRGMEGVVRRARLANPMMDIVMIHFLNGSHLSDLRAGRTPTAYAAHDAVAARYGIPVLNVTALYLREEKAGRMTWADYADCHPKPKGNDMVAAELGRLLDAEGWGRASFGKPEAYPLPEPVDARSYFRGGFLPFAAVTKGAGWSVLPFGWRGKGDGLVTTAPGGECSFAFTGTALGIYHVCRPDDGILEVSVDGAPWTRVSLYHKSYSKRLRYPHTVMLADDLADGAHTARIRLAADRASSEATGVAAAILRIAVNGAEQGSVAGGRSVRTCRDGWAFAPDAAKSRGVGRHLDALPWKQVELPYDWAICGPWEKDRHGDKLPWKDRVGWYRKSFSLTTAEVARVASTGRRLFLDFDGVMEHAVVYLNGCPVGRGEYGYLGFRCDLTPYLRAGENTLYVRADTENMYSRWYPGAGIERRVRLFGEDAVRFEHESVFATTPSVSKERARVRVTGRIVYPSFADGSADVTAVLRAPDGREAARTSARVPLVAREGGAFELALDVRAPVLWELVDPAPLYTLDVLLSDGVHADRETIRVGLRSFAFDPARGFILNGRRVQLNGVDLHTDMGILGMAFNRSVMRRQLKRMRDMGANALRTSHNAQAPELLDLCDEMGIFVWNECFDKWDGSAGIGDNNLEDFVSRQLKNWARRDRNHPSVFVWSIGNEIHSTAASPDRGLAGTTFERCALFRDAVRTMDRTRPVGIGSCFSGPVSRTGDYDCLDITGWNYGGQYATYRAHMPTKPLLYSESASCVSSHGYYADTLPTNKIEFATRDKEVDSMDHNSAPWSDIPDKEFERMERDLFACGEFVWTGIDYLGEPYPYMHYLNEVIMKMPVRELARSAYFGICDLMAFPKDRFYLYRSHWNRDAFTLHIAPDHWNFPGREGKNRPVYVYTSAETAELFLNGRSLGKRTKDRTIVSDNNTKANTDAYGGIDGYRDPSGYYRLLDRYRLRWLNVPYAPGELKAVAYGADGRVLGTEILRTAGDPVAVTLAPESGVLPPDGETYVFVRVNLADAEGRPVPNRRDFVSFALKGPGEILAVGNADPRQNDRTFKQVDGHPLYFGQAGLVLRRTRGAAGPVTLTATAQGLRAATVTFR